MSLNVSYVSFLAVQIYDLLYNHLHSSPSTGILRTRNVTSSRWLDGSVGRALHRYRRVPLMLNLISELLKLCL